MPIPIITRTNTIDEWRIQTNQEANALNNLETGTYTKSNGTLTLSGNSALILTANGTALQVSNGALFQSNVAIGKDLTIGQQDTATGNATVAGVVTILGPGSALLVANNARVNGDIQIARSVYSGNVSSNNNLTVGQNATINGILRLDGTGDSLYVNTGIAKINTATITDLSSTNVSAELVTITEEYVDRSYVTIGETLRSNAYNLTSTTANIATLNVVTGVTISGNVVNLSSNVAQINTASIGVGSITNATLGTVNVSGSASVGTTLNITGNTTSGNLVTSNLTQTGALRTNTQVDIGTTLSVGTSATVGTTLNVTGNTSVGNLTTSNSVSAGNITVSNRATVGSLLAGATTLDSTTINGILSVNGNFVVTGSTIFDTNIFTLRSSVPQPYGSGYSYLGVNRGEGNFGLANANSYIRWNEPAKYWDIRDVDNPTSYSKILTANLISDSLNSISSDTLASSKSANTLNVRIETANTNLRNYTNSYIANTVANTNAIVSANITLLAASSNSYTDTTVSTANTNLRNYTDGAISTANTRLKSYVDGTMYAKTGGTISGDVVISGNLTTQGTVTYINSQQVQIGDNIITLNADISPSATPIENAGLEVDRGVSANTLILWNESTDKWTYTNDGVNYQNIGSESGIAQADQRAVTSGVYANSAYSQANTATTNAATADQRAVTSGSYANSAFIVANNAPTKTGTGASGTWSISITGNAGTVAGLAVATGRNNVGNQIVRTDASGYLQVGYLNSNAGNENNASAPPRIWGTNGTDDYLRTYQAASVSVGYASSAGNADTVDGWHRDDIRAWGNLTGKPFNYTAQSGQPTYVWGTNDGTNYYVWNPSNFSVNYATSSGTSSYVSINYNNDSNSTYQMLWGSGNGVYATAGVYVNPYSDTLYASTLYSNGDLYGSIFYDINNTGYYCDPNSTSRMNYVLADTVYSYGEVTAYSDDRLKNKFGNISDALLKVDSLNGFYYEANDVAVELGYKKYQEVGLSAQEVQKILPEAVVPIPVNPEYLTVKYDRLVPLLIEAIKELKTRVEELENNKSINA